MPYLNAGLKRALIKSHMIVGRQYPSLNMAPTTTFQKKTCLGILKEIEVVLFCLVLLLNRQILGHHNWAKMLHYRRFLEGFRPCI